MYRTIAYLGVKYVMAKNNPLSLVVLFLALAALFTISGYAYTLWYGQLKVSAVIEMGDLEAKICKCPLIVIVCNKVVINETCHSYHCMICRYIHDVEVDNNRLAIYINAKHVTANSTLWILYTIKNTGTLPLKLNKVIASSSTPVSYMKTRIYGPYRFSHHNIHPLSLGLDPRNKCHLISLSPKGRSPPVVFDLNEFLFVLVEIKPSITNTTNIRLALFTDVSLWSS